MKDMRILYDDDIIDLITDSKIIKDDLKKSFQYNISSSLTDILSGIDNVKEIISPEKTYIAKFPKAILEKMALGQYDIMKGKDGDLLSTIIDKALPPNRNIVHQLRLEEINSNIYEKVKNLNTNITNIAIQQQLADLSKITKEIKTLVIGIKRGQIIDRIGFVNSGKAQLEQAIELKDSNPNKRDIIINSIKSFNDGRAQLKLYIKDELEKIEKIPQSKFAIFFKSLLNNEFYSNIETQFEELQECIKAYLEATNLLVIAYQILESNEALPKVLADAKEVIEISSEKMIILAEIALDGNQNNNNYWYNNSKELIKKIDACNTEVLNTEYFSIEFSGDKILLEDKYE